MALAAGTRLGPYEILAPIGAGGMGEVYRAKDTKLKREVALKVLPEAFAEDPERMARFQREAEVLASLNHPNIAQIYGVEEQAIVMELVEGESPKGPMPFDEAWKIALQVAAGLEYAHEKSIVHRDLKPANVKVTADGAVKLLDFGLAKAFTGQTVASTDLENSPTLTLGTTQLGVILGTAAYMAPEQAKGKAVDKRADIWSFGVVLYELLTGERLFTGDDVSDTLAQVLTKEPDLCRVPTQVRRLLRRCLEKDPKQRLRDIGEARFLLEETQAPTDAASPRSRRVFAGWVLAAAAIVASAVSLFLLWPRPVIHPLMRFTDDLGAEISVDSGAGPALAIAPDGSRLAYVSRDSKGNTHLSVRPLSSPKSTLLEGTEGAAAPFFSPDSRWIAFFADQKLKKISVEGGGPVTLCDIPNLRGVFWGEDGYILFSAQQSPLLRVSSVGGAPEAVTLLKNGEITNRYGQLLPGGGALLFTASYDNNF